jgi:hypothetical protein
MYIRNSLPYHYFTSFLRIVFLVCVFVIVHDCLEMGNSQDFGHTDQYKGKIKNHGSTLFSLRISIYGMFIDV